MTTLEMLTRNPSLAAISDADLVADIRGRTNKTKRYLALMAEAKRRKLQGCDGCAGDGVYRGQTSHGVCFRCEGKGFQNDSDRRRNWGYDHYWRGFSSANR